MKKPRSTRGQIRKGTRAALEATRPLVAGIDIGSQEHWVCGPEREDGEREVRVFGATTPQLKGMAAWLIEQGVESVAMESNAVSFAAQTRDCAARRSARIRARDDHGRATRRAEHRGPALTAAATARR